MAKTVKELAEALGAAFVGNGELSVNGISSFSKPEPNSLAFSESITEEANFEALKSCCVVTNSTEHINLLPSAIYAKNPKFAFAVLARIVRPKPRIRSGVNSLASVHESAKIGQEVAIAEFASIGENSTVGARTQIHSGVRIGNNVKIGKDSVIHCNAVIYDGCIIGNNVEVHAGTVIGAEGFGYVRGDDGYIQFPQIGSVIIEDLVEIGANSCIDRGALGVTRIGRGTKIDNLVQIAHNVHIGERVVIASQTGISGSTIIEDDCVFGGQVGVSDHVTVKKGAMFGGQAGVFKRIVRPGVYFGSPIQRLDEYKKHNARLRMIEKLHSEVADLKKKRD